MKKTPNIEIVLIEDNNEDADLTIRSLKKYKLENEILRLHDGEEALDYFFRQGKYEHIEINYDPKVILLDLKMPKVDGLEVLKALKSNEKTKSIPVVILTSSQEEKDIIRSYNLGANSYIVKPVDFIKFAESIKEIGFYWLIQNKSPH